MSLHLVKLCVGIDSIAQLAGRQAARLKAQSDAGKTPELYHRTRMMPRRKEELLAGGSIYWVIRGVIQVRQRITAIRRVRGDDGVARCDIVLAPELIATRPQPRRAFQGWRYLEGDDAPGDLGPADAAIADIPPAMKRELLELGLI
ncbi:MAG: DUF1489 family protein [Alphaproteobacteria bacterium]|nr:MAG: DUF1489 family protein [Alphaproteobacteria bacterium]